MFIQKLVRKRISPNTFPITANNPPISVIILAMLSRFARVISDTYDDVLFLVRHSDIVTVSCYVQYKNLIYTASSQCCVALVCWSNEVPGCPRCSHTCSRTAISGTTATGHKSVVNDKQSCRNTNGAHIVSQLAILLEKYRNIYITINYRNINGT